MADSAARNARARRVASPTVPDTVDVERSHQGPAPLPIRDSVTRLEGGYSVTECASSPDWRKATGSTPSTRPRCARVSLGCVCLGGDGLVALRQLREQFRC